MKIVIDIPDAICERFGYEYSEQNLISKDTNEAILDAFCNGTPLPKGHGRLIDAKRFEEDNQEFWERDFIHPKYEDRLCDLIDDAPTIIEADKEGEPE